MTTTGLNKKNLVVKSGVFKVGRTYKVEGCVWQGVCAGQLLQFRCGPSGGQCHVLPNNGKFRILSVLVNLVCIRYLMIVIVEKLIRRQGWI